MGNASRAAARVLASILLAAAAGCASHSGVTRTRPALADLWNVRGANYRAAGAANTTDYWQHYDPAETERDLGYADKLKLNQLRVFVNEASMNADRAAFRRNLADLARACARHHIGLMITIGDSASFIGGDGSIGRGRVRAFVTELVSAIGKEPALAFWDASNEPDYNAPGSPPDREAKRIEIAKLAAATFHELDPKTPVTIGVANEATMESLEGAVDVLTFHDYLGTRDAIAADVARAKAFASRVGKPVMDTETGCIARANPYDVTLEEHEKAKVGWYVWELMITKKWGDVHGVFYPDGTVRDPSIPAAMLGLFRNRSDSAVPENVNREGWVNVDVAAAEKWLADANGDWKTGLDAAERLANLLEPAQLVAMREPPSRAVAMLRKGEPNRDGLRPLLGRLVELLKPFERPGATNASPANATPPPTTPVPRVAYPFTRREGSRTPADTSTIRGVNYCYAEYGGHPGMWDHYSEATTERDLNYAQRIGINQIRVFLAYSSYEADPQKFLKNLRHLVRAADARGMGVMPVVTYSRAMQGDGYPGVDAYAKALVDAIGNEPGLAFWDVSNEPDYPYDNPERTARRVAFARHMAGVFKKLDPQTPITIGFAFEPTMEASADFVDVMVYHGYQQTRQEVRDDIERARRAGAAAKKQVINDEIGCIARANPYDMAIEEYLKAGMGCYPWELMIVWNPAGDERSRGWGDVHGFFYPDGTVRDPSIPMAMLGIFRNRGPDVVLERPNREGRVTREIAAGEKWLADPNAGWAAGLATAEAMANLLESAQLVPLHELPTRQVALLRAGNEDRDALRDWIAKASAALKPYAN